MGLSLGTHFLVANKHKKGKALRLVALRTQNSLQGRKEGKGGLVVYDQWHCVFLTNTGQ